MTSTTTANAAAPLSPARFRAAIAAALTTMLLGALDQTIVSVAVPTIAQQLGGFGWLAWVVSAYLIAATIVTPLYGKFSDVHGRRRVMAVAIGVFVLGSAGCALAASMPQLVLARVVQGLGGGGLIAMAQAVIADVVPMRERGRYQGYISIVWALASVCGPLVGGLLTEYLSWPWIFWINLPLGALALLLVHGGLPRQSAARRRTRLDLTGIALLVIGLAALLLPITRIGQGSPPLAPANLGGLVLAGLALAAFWRWEQRAADPILPIGLLRQRVVLAACAMLFLCFFLFIALSVLVPLRVQLLTGASESQAALRLLPLSLGIPIAAFACGRTIYKTGRLLPLQRLGVGLVPFALAAVAFVPPQHTWASSGLLVVLGIGFGCQLPTTLLTVQNCVPRELLGTATALTAFFRQLGGAVGIAVLSALLLALLHEAAPGAAGGIESMGRWLDEARRNGSGAAGAGDAAFRITLLVGAGVSLLGWWCVAQLPDVRMESAAKPRQN